MKLTGSNRDEVPGGAQASQRDSSRACASTAYIAISRFRVANDKLAEVKQAFRERPHLVDEAEGFLRLEVMSPLDAPEEIWLVTHWADEQSFRRWHHSHLYHESHRGIPKGLKLVPGSAELRFFELVTS